MYAVNGLTLGAAALDKAIRYGEARCRHLARQRSPFSPRQTDRSAYHVDDNRPAGTLDEYHSKSLAVAVGIAVDPVFGPVVVAGLGGVFVDALAIFRG